MSNLEFMHFVRRPRYIEDQDGIQLFEDKKVDEGRKNIFSENLKKLIPLVLTLLLGSLYFAETLEAAIFNHIVYFWIFGVISCWTFTEYFFHRFMLHTELNLDPNAPADGKKNARIFSTHVHHHVFTNQKHRIVLNMGLYV